MTVRHIIQFGTSRFLQAHVDLFASEAMAAGQDVPPIVVIQTTRDPVRAARVAAFGAPEGYPVHIRGLETDGKVVDRTITVRSVATGLAAAQQWHALVSLFVEGCDYVVSNTGDNGYVVDAEDRGPALLIGEIAPRSFPAMLLALLHRRWRAGGAPVTLLPCELLRRNGDVLKGIIAGLARDVGAEPAFIAWLDKRCLWVNTLVDRIVSEPIEPVGAVAEPYALWALERQSELAMPFTHPAIVLTDDLDAYERLKLHILNLGHSWLAQRWIDAGRTDGETVRSLLADPATRDALDRLYAGEVVPGFAARGMGDEAKAYVEATVARFANPFLDHRLSDIAGSHKAKLEKRVGGFVDWVREGGAAPPMPELDALTARVRVAA